MIDPNTIPVIVAVLSLIGTGVGTFGGIRASNKLTNYKIEEMRKEIGELKEQVKSHNNFNGRLIQCEGFKEDIERIEEKVDKHIDAA